MATIAIGKIRKFGTNAEGGAIRIFSDAMSYEFAAGSGDGHYEVVVIEQAASGFDPAHTLGGQLWRFVGGFTVHGEVALSSCDWEDHPIYQFTPGRWQVFHQRDERRVCIVRIE